MFSLRANKSMRLQRFGAWIAYHDTQSDSVFWWVYAHFYFVYKFNPVFRFPDLDQSSFTNLAYFPEILPCVGTTTRPLRANGKSQLKCTLLRITIIITMDKTQTRTFLRRYSIFFFFSSCELRMPCAFVPPNCEKHCLSCLYITYILLFTFFL